MKKIDKSVPFSATKAILSFFLVYHGKQSILRLFLLGTLKLSILIVVPIATFVHLIVVKKKELDVPIAENVSIGISISAMTILSTLVPFYSKEWTNVFEKLSDFKTFKKPSKLGKTIKLYNTLSIASSAYCGGGAVFYTIACYFESKKCLDIDKENYAIFVVQFIMIFVTCVCGGAVNYLICEVALYASLQISSLKTRFLEIIHIKAQEEQDTKLNMWIQDHQSMIIILEEAKRLTKICVGAGSLSFALVCASVANQIMNRNKPVGSVLHLVGWIASLFMHCHAGQIIMSDSESMAEAVYNSKWYKINLTTRKSILIILKRCQKPLTLDALPQGSLNYPLFMMIAKSSYSLLTFLSNT
ncbi:odorant receptor 22c-like [Diorhabda carinulata]|uniref:odorant receptor 22c-like n=1 Tax=Diorhabda carinulata TaxID=1163345 RepID=UPI0025A07646|nr:odorant receptor 22c-like [Diorhabda carinulata]